MSDQLFTKIEKNINELIKLTQEESNYYNKNGLNSKVDIILSKCKKKRFGTICKLNPTLQYNFLKTKNIEVIDGITLKYLRWWIKKNPEYNNLKGIELFKVYIPVPSIENQKRILKLSKKNKIDTSIYEKDIEYLNNRLDRINKFKQKLNKKIKVVSKSNNIVKIHKQPKYKIKKWIPPDSSESE
jgi:hypothetical protein